MITPATTTQLVQQCTQCGHRNTARRAGCVIIAPDQCPKCGSDKHKLEKASIKDKLVSALNPLPARSCTGSK